MTKTKKTIITSAIIIVSLFVTIGIGNAITLWYLDGTTLKPVDSSWTIEVTGLGDVESVGDCTSGACLDGTSDGGTYISFYDAQGIGKLITGNLTTARTWTMPDATGTVALTTSNVSTATALAGNPTDCAANNYAYQIDASGNLTCSTIDISSSTNLVAGRSLTMSGDSVEADAELYKCHGGIYFEDPTATDDFKSIGYTNTAYTITKIWCESDQTVNMDLQVDDGSPADVIGTDLVCASTPVSTTTFAGDTTVAAENTVDLAITSVSGTPTWVSIHWICEYDD